MTTTTTLALLGLSLIGTWILLGSRSTGRSLAGECGWARSSVTVTRTLGLVPVGVAAMVVLGGDPPMTVAAALGGLLALLHRWLPIPFRLIAGLIGTAIVITEAFGGTDCREPIGLGGLAVLVLGAGAATSAVARPSSPPPGWGRTTGMVVAMCAGSLVAVFAVAPVGGIAVGATASPLLVAAVGLLVGFAGATARSSEIVHAALGLGLVATNVVLVVDAGPCGAAPADLLIGSTAFALVGAVLSPRASRRAPVVRAPVRT